MEKIFPGQTHKITFVRNDTDPSSDINLMLPNPQLVEFALETPNGQIIVPKNASTAPVLTFSHGYNVASYRIKLPLLVGHCEREGARHVLIKTNENYYHKMARW